MEKIKSFYENNKQVFVSYFISTFIGIIFIPTMIIFSELEFFSPNKIINHKIFISLNIIFLLGLNVYKLICSNKNIMNILLLWCYVHLSWSVFLLFSGIIDYSNLYSIIEGFNIYTIIYFILSTGAIFYFNYLIKEEKKESKDNDSRNNKPKIIYESRKEKAEYLKKLLKSKEKNMILIDGEWGIGKSYFVDSAIDEIKEEYHKIFIDVLLFSYKEQLIDNTLNEINTILVNAGIRSNAISKYKGVLKVISESSPIKFGHFLENDSLEIIEKNIEKDLEKLGKPIYILVDNLERILEMRRVIDILGFLHKIYEIGDNSLNIIVLADSSKLIKKEITSEYLQKFFPKTIFLRQINKYEILEAEYNYILDKKEELKNSKLEENYCINLDFNLYSSFKSSFESLDNLITEKMDKVNNDVQSFKDYYMPRFRKAIESLNNARNVRYIINKSFDNFSIYKNIYKMDVHFNDEFYFKEVILITIFKEFFEEDMSSIFKRIEPSTFISPASEIAEDKYPLRFIQLFFTGLSFIKNIPSETREKVSKSLARLLKDSGKVEEDFSLLYMGKILDNDFSNLTFMDCNLYFKIYTEYLDRKNNSEEIYQKIMDNYYESLKFDSISDIVSLNNFSILMQDKLYSLKNNRSFFDKMNFLVVPTQSEMIEIFKGVYLDELKYYTEYYLKSDKLISSFEDFKTVYEEYTSLKFDDFKEIVNHINNNTFNKENEFLRIEFELLGKKMSTIANRENYHLITNTIINLTSEIEKYKKLELEISQNTNKDLKFLYTEKHHLRIKISKSLLHDFSFMLGNFIHFPSDSSDREYIINFIKKTPRIFYNEIIQAIGTIEYNTFKKLFDLDFILFLLNKNDFKFDVLIENIIEITDLSKKINEPMGTNLRKETSINYNGMYKNIYNKISLLIISENLRFSVNLINLLFENFSKQIKENLHLEGLKNRIISEIENTYISEIQ